MHLAQDINQWQICKHNATVGSINGGKLFINSALSFSERTLFHGFGVNVDVLLALLRKSEF
jgi:hypothetical protein